MPWIKNSIDTGATNRMRSLMLKYSSQPSSFLSNWCGFYREMSLLGVDVSRAGLKVSDGWSPLLNGNMTGVK